MPPLRTDQLDYNLPPDRIAITPAHPRDAARLMVFHRAQNKIEHHHVRDIPSLGLLQKNDLLIVNQTRVLPAFFHAKRTTTGGNITGLYLQSTPAKLHDSAPQARRCESASCGAGSSQAPTAQWQVLLEARGKLKPGETITFTNNQTATLTRSLGQGQWELDTTADLHAVGQTPLPPYIRKARKKLGYDSTGENSGGDIEQYNTLYATTPGSIAAPTAGLHFTAPLLQAIEALGVRRAVVTLHIGVGTFMPVRTETLDAHTMHHESIHVPIETIQALRETRAAGGRVIPIGTTTIRALESLPASIDTLTDDYRTNTNLFIYPDSPNFRGQGFRFADAVMTNFHLPRSTLLAMIATLPNVGLARLLTCYQTAIEKNYRFYSYGDAMWLAP